MSFQVTTAFVQQFRATVYHLAQQKGSKLRDCVRVEPLNGESGFFEQIGLTSMVRRTSRHQDTPTVDVPHLRRRVTSSPYEWSELIDKADKVRMLSDPTSQYVEAAAMAAGRTIDENIVAAADAVAFTGKDGSTSTAYDTAMTVAVNTITPGASAGDRGLNVEKLAAAAERLNTRDIDPDEERYCIINGRQLRSLISDTRISSGDYNLLRPLYDGQVSRFMGFHIKMCNRIVTDANADDKVLYWAKGGILLGVADEIRTEIAKDPGKSFSTRVFCALDVGATRMEESRVGVILCDPSTGP